MKCILSSDFDDTYYIKDISNSIEKNNILIKQFIEKSNIFVLNTSRTKNSYIAKINTVAKENIVANYYSFNDGTAIFDSKLRLIFKKNISVKIVEKILDILDKSDIISIKDENGNISNKYNANLIEVPKFYKHNNIDTLIKLNKCKSITYRIQGNTLYIHSSLVNKGTAHETIRVRENISKELSFSIGDNNNDFEMFNVTKSFLVINERNKNFNYKNIDYYVSNLNEALKIISFFIEEENEYERC